MTAEADTVAKTTLVPMRAEVFAAYTQHSIASYAEENIASGRWPREGALERSRADFDALLPLGLATPNHYVFEIMDANADPQAATPVGVLWFAVEERHDVRSAFIYDVEIASAHRRHGHARRAFEALEPLVRELGLGSIGLHVFAHNPGAQALYESLGYRVNSLNMTKHLGA
jgi:ribosomal protein S18 acetylase RimI-like enzyme